MGRHDVDDALVVLKYWVQFLTKYRDGVVAAVYDSSRNRNKNPSEEEKISQVMLDDATYYLNADPNV